MSENISSIYRLRPAKSFLLNELEENYLWFSKPTAFRDTEDANITSFVKNNLSIKDSFDRIYKNSQEILHKSKHIGICCFTDELPEFDLWKKFPLGKNGVFIEYDREILEDYFLRNFGIEDCFIKVDYNYDATKFPSYNDKYDILWDIDEEGGLWYEPLAKIEKDIKLKDELFKRMFTRLDFRHINQNESRIILGGYNIIEYDDKVFGYKIIIPPGSIKRIHIHPNTPDEIKVELIEKYDIKVVSPK